MVEVATVITKRPQKLWRLKLSIVSSAAPLEHSLEGENQFSSKVFSFPFSDSFRMALETSVAIGEPF